MASWLDRLRDPDRATARAMRVLDEQQQAARRSRTAPTPMIRALELGSRAPVTTPITAPGLETRKRPRAVVDQTDGGVAAGSTSMWKRHSSQLASEEKRRFADENEWVRAAINRIKGRISRSARDIVPIDPNKPYDVTVQARILALVENPNPKADSWRSFIEPPVEDILVLGKGGWEYVRNFKGFPLALMPFDAARMNVVPDWDGSEPQAARYVWRRGPGKNIGLANDDVTLVLLNPATHRPEGLGPIETLHNSILADSAGNEFIRSMLQKYPPPGWLHLGKSAGQKSVDVVQEQLTGNVFGKGGFLVTAGMDDPKFQTLWGGSSRDNELMAWSEYFARKICAVFGISPQDLGLTFDINKSTGDTQADLSSEDGFKLTLMLIEDYINKEVIAKFGRPEVINLKFHFKELTLRDRLRLAEIAQKVLGGTPAVMFNEARGLMDLQPVDGGNLVLAPTPNGPVAVIGPDAKAYRDELAQFARENADIGVEPGSHPNGEQASGAGGKKANSDRAKTKSVDAENVESIALHMRSAEDELSVYLEADMRAMVRVQQRLSGKSALEPEQIRAVYAHVCERAVYHLERDTALAEALCITRGIEAMSYEGMAVRDDAKHIISRQIAETRSYFASCAAMLPPGPHDDSAVRILVRRKITKARMRRTEILLSALNDAPHEDDE